MLAGREHLADFDADGIARWYSQKLPILVLFYDQAQPIYPP
jgi:hypothetical protein